MELEGKGAGVRIDAPFGGIYLKARHGFLESVVLEPGSQQQRPISLQEADPGLCEWVAWILAYLKAPATPPPPIGPGAGTPFQRRVHAALQTIPAGSVVTYGQLAQQLGTGPRALAGALRANRLPLVIPCHRVIAAHGLGGFCGEARGERVGIKRWLLAHEGAILREDA